jgi:O-antigen ligase
MPLALLRAIEERRGWLAFAALIMGASVALGGSRTGMALIVAEGAVLLAGARYRFAAIAVVAIGGLAFAAEIGARDDGHRREIYSSAVEIARQNPITGVGLGAFETAYPAHARFDNGLIVDHAHSDWLEWPAEVGLLGTAPLLLLALWSAREALRQPWAIGVVAVYLHAAVDYPLHKPALILWHYALLAALVAGRAAAKRRVRLGID